MTEKYSLENIMIIGAMKSGTSFLFHYLSQHPEICPSKRKEPGYFARKMRLIKETEREYMDLFEVDSAQHKFTLEGSTAYAKYPSESGVPKRIVDYGLNPKFIYILRNPFERIESHYNFMRGKQEQEKEIDREYLINLSKYFQQLEQFAEYFSPNQILILDFDELIQHPKETLKRVFDFIGATDFDIKTAFKVKNKGILTTPKRERFKKYFEPVFTYFPYLSEKILKFLFPLKIKKVKLAPEQRQKIYHLLEEDMICLYQKYKVDIRKWGFQNLTEYKIEK